MTPDKEEQIALVGVAVRLGIVVWSGFCLTLAYIDLPGFPKQTFDPTFIASVFTGTLATFGVQAGKSSKKDKTEGSTGGGTVQTIKIEQMPLKIVPATPPTK